MRRRNSSLPFRRGPNLFIYHILVALLFPKTSATFISLQALQLVFGDFYKPLGTSATFVSL
jgi:hypothetical protein